MSWAVLIGAGMLEAVWAGALSASKNFKKLTPSIIFVLALSASMAGLAFAMRTIPTGIAYPVWVGIGATLTMIWGFVTKEEELTWDSVLLLIALIGCVVGLKAVS